MTAIYVILEAGEDQNNVTGSGASYNIEWNTEVLLADPNMFDANTIQVPGNTQAQVGVHLHLSGVTALNSRLEIYLDTPDGDLPLYDGNPASLLSINNNLIINTSRAFLLNPDNETYLFNIKIKMSGGLTNSVDVASDSQWWIVLN